jgi:hypothetical protein
VNRAGKRTRQTFHFDLALIRAFLCNERMDKQCFKCRETKPLSEFYKHAMMADGHLNKCKTCTKRDTAERVSKLSTNPIWVEQERDRCRLKSERARANGIIYKTDPKANHRWRKRNPSKARAHGKAAVAVRNGAIRVATICERCGAAPKQLHKHHPDYSKPLDIIWLCSKCHGLAHRKPFGAPIIHPCNP